jgi:hypothetical protein
MTMEQPNGAFRRGGELAFAPNPSPTRSSDDPLKVTNGTYGDTFDSHPTVRRLAVPSKPQLASVAQRADPAAQRIPRRPVGVFFPATIARASS